jgi:predicted murein hydrolase (TIGR00659 family)
MKQLFLNESLYFGFFVSIAAYQAGLMLKKRLGHAIFNPILVAVALIIALLSALGIGYETYFSSAKYLSYLLTPATVCLAIPLYEQISLLRKNYKAILAGTLAGALSSLTGVFLLALLFKFTARQYVTLLPKSVTTAIGIGISGELGGIESITVAAIIMSGIFGNIIAPALCRLLGICEPVAKGVAIGSASHVIGTAKAMEIGEVEGAMSSLAVVLSGIITVALAPFFAKLIA